MSVEEDKDSGSVWIGQPVYTEKLLMQDCKRVSAPVESCTKQNYTNQQWAV